MDYSEYSKLAAKQDNTLFIIKAVGWFIVMLMAYCAGYILYLCANM